MLVCYDIKCLLGSEETLGFSRGRGKASLALAAALQASRSPGLTAPHPLTPHACPPAQVHTEMTANTQARRHAPAITHLHTQTQVHARGHTAVCVCMRSHRHAHTPLGPRPPEAPSPDLPRQPLPSISTCPPQGPRPQGPSSASCRLLGRIHGPESYG